MIFGSFQPQLKDLTCISFRHVSVELNEIKLGLVGVGSALCGHVPLLSTTEVGNKSSHFKTENAQMPQYAKYCAK